MSRTTQIQIKHLMSKHGLSFSRAKLIADLFYGGGNLMRDLPNTPSIPFLAETTASKLDQMHDRLLSEVRHHMKRSEEWQSGVEPNVELLLPEAELMAENLTRAAYLLRHVAKGEAA